MLLDSATILFLFSAHSYNCTIQALKREECTSNPCGAEMEGTSKASESEMVLETLRRRGWCFGDVEQVKAIIFIQSALADDTSKVTDSVESELLNSDLRSIGGNSLPQRKSTYLHGPKVLQISSVRDISKSSVDEFSKSSGGRRLLRLCLTDGQSEITAIEYSHIPSIPDNVVPGTKIRLENKASIHSGILCLSAAVLTVLGGVVQSLYEEWQMNQKYSGFTRSSLKQLEESSSADGPPPFEKLQVGSSSGNGRSNTRSSRLTAGPSSTETRPIESQRNPDRRTDNVNINPKSISTPEKAEEKPSSSSTRPKEVVESVPVQNQAAAQKLLQKLTHQNKNDRDPKGRKHRGKGKQEDQVVFTLEEYESRKAKTKPPLKDEVPDISNDEDLAWQLQNQMDLEDSRVQHGSHGANAEDIKLSMFNYDRGHDGAHQMGHGGRGRGRGRGGGRGRGRERGRGRGRYG